MQTKIQILREITPLTSADCFTIFSRTKTQFDFPIHFHEEFELNFIKNAKGAKRVVGDHVEEIGEYELVLLGPNLQHSWFTHKCTSTEITEVTYSFIKTCLMKNFFAATSLVLSAPCLKIH